MKNKKAVHIFLTILWMAVIFIFSSQNGETSNMNNTFIVNILKKLGFDLAEALPQINYLIRKLAHFTEYFILGVLLFRTYSHYISRGTGKVSILTGFLYACSDEIHQYFVPGRGPAFTDVLIDTMGVIFGVVVIFVLCRAKVREAGMHRL